MHNETLWISCLSPFSKIYTPVLIHKATSVEAIANLGNVARPAYYSASG
jgi:hypothetical protein